MLDKVSFQEQKSAQRSPAIWMRLLRSRNSNFQACVLIGSTLFYIVTYWIGSREARKQET